MGRRAASQEGWADAEVAPSREGQWAVDSGQQRSAGRGSLSPCPPPAAGPSVLPEGGDGSGAALHGVLWVSLTSHTCSFPSRDPRLRDA